MFLNRTNTPRVSHYFTPIMFDQDTSDGCTTKDVLLGLTMGMFVVISLCSNLLVITTILATRRLRSVSSIFVVNMAICDLGVSVVSMPLVLSSILNGGWWYSQLACSVTGSLFTTFAIGSILSTAVISLDRFFAIVYCLQYSTWKTMYYGGTILFCLWFQACAFGLVPLAGWGDFRFDQNRYMCVVTWSSSLSYAILNGVLCYCVPFILMTVCYVKIILVARQHVLKIEGRNHHIQINSPESSHVSLNGAVAAAAMFSVRRLSMLSFPGSVDETTNVTGSPIEMDFNSGTCSENTTSPFRRDVRTIIRLLGLILAFVICWTPYLYVNIAEMLHLVIPSSVVTLSTWFALMLSCINPFSYAVSSKRFRFATRKLLNYKNRHKYFANRNYDNNQSSYTLFLKTLRSPSVSSDPRDSRRLMRMCSLDEVLRNVTELRPSSASTPNIKMTRTKKQYLEVPTQNSFTGTYTQMPLQYREPDVLPVTDRSVLNRSPRRNTSPDAICQDKELEDFIFSKNNKAKITIKFDLVPN